MVTYTLPLPREWHGDAGFHPCVRAQRRGGSRAAQTLLADRLTQVASQFLPLLANFSLADRVSSRRLERGEESEGGGMGWTVVLVAKIISKFCGTAEIEGRSLR